MLRMQRDRIARRAAELLAAQRAVDINAAIASAAHELGSVRGAPLPSAALVRRHAQGMAMEALGLPEYQARVRARLADAAHVMDTLEQALGATTLLAGRAALGHVDADPTFHIRVYTRLPVPQIAQALVDEGFSEPELRTVETRFGRANQLRFTLAGAQVAVLRCLPEWMRESRADLVSRRNVPTRTLEQVRREVDADGSAQSGGQTRAEG